MTGKARPEAAAGTGADSSRLDGRVIAVAGAGGSLGPAVVRALAAAGAQVAATDARAEAVEPLGGICAHTAVADLASEDGAVQWRDAIVSELGHVDGLVHLVGGWRGGTPLDEAPLEDLDLLHTLLFRTVVHTTRAFAADLRAAGANGRFALVSALAAQRPTANNAAYAAMKAAAEAWTLAFAAELEDSGATANLVVVNALLTDEMRAANPDKPYRTFTHVDDVADALTFLCSDRAQKMSGQRVALHAS